MARDPNVNTYVRFGKILQPHHNWPPQPRPCTYLAYARRTPSPAHILSQGGGGLVFGKPDVLQRNRTMTTSTRIVRSRRTTSVWFARLVLGPLLPFVFYRRGQLETLSPHPTMEILDIITI